MKEHIRSKNPSTSTFENFPYYYPANIDALQT